MKLHEYQAKDLLRAYGVDIPPYFIFSSAEELEQKLLEHGWNEGVFKAQIHAGGRGKVGGVKIARTREQCFQYGMELLGKRFQTAQTGSEALVCSVVLCSLPVQIAQEYYIAWMIDRAHASVSLLCSAAGGVEIEEIVHRSPEALCHLKIPEDCKIRPYHVLRVMKFLQLPEKMLSTLTSLLQRLTDAFAQNDMTLLEINPLALTHDQCLFPLDAKVLLDQNAAFRHPEWEARIDKTQSHPLEIAAKELGFSYVSLDGNIGCIVNGAGLAMATMDLLSGAGGKPANFLDIGGSASQTTIENGFRMVLLDPKVTAIFVNIFGGIMNCATLAAALIETFRNLHVQLPTVIRIEGTDVEQAKILLQQSGLPLQIASDLSEGARLAVASSKRVV